MALPGQQPGRPAFRRMAVRARLAVALVGVLTAALLTTVVSTANAAEGDTVTVEQGQLRGTVGDGYRSFVGIPFAAPPTGDLRWKPPSEPASWSGTRSATTAGSDCAQNSVDASGNPTVGGSEDCLYLNVYTPHTAGKSLSDAPVLVWIHGGVFVLGSGSQYDPTTLVTEGNVIVVTVNYRLGPFGFLAHSDLDARGANSGVYGLLDQQAALRWVQDNIASFGGDSSNVTVAGESAGAMSICDQLLAPSSAGLFQKAVVMSGPCDVTPLRARSDAQAAGADFAAQLGCSSNTASCLRAETTADLLAASSELGLTAWTPVVDGSFLTTGAEGFRSGDYTKLPSIIGGVRDEAHVFVEQQFDGTGNPVTAAQYPDVLTGIYGSTNGPLVAAEYPAESYSSPSLALAAAQSDFSPTLPLGACSDLATYQATAPNAAVFAYEFADTAAPSASSALGTTAGAYHGSELQYLFTITGFGDGPDLSSTQATLAHQLRQYWANFARGADPNGRGLTSWPRYRSSSSVLAFAPSDGGGTRTVDIAARHNCSFWTELGY
ncbi:carboxylesterase/lipase family protein [Frankia sp. QA3]|uniref:carboxylesterase/lipase family protein n=1 Tax=Frankia sp. QA3 TaxID=710111 RepID=UPI000269BE06|nr:carboxylesterase family protein [Frankia sp. QA3]EIV92851.1 carboxylesterase type B [Frankia sp. QA3]